MIDALIQVVTTRHLGTRATLYLVFDLRHPLVLAGVPTPNYVISVDRPMANDRLHRCLEDMGTTIDRCRIGETKIIPHVDFAPHYKRAR